MSYYSVRLCIPTQKKSVSRACSPEVTSCFTWTSVANVLPATCFLMGLNMWKPLGPALPTWPVVNHGWETIDHRPYSPDLAPPRFTFRPLTKHLAGNWFSADAEVKQAVPSRLPTLDTDFSYARIKAMVSRRDKLFNINADYVNQLLPMWCVETEVKIKVLSDRLLLHY